MIMPSFFDSVKSAVDQSSSTFGAIANGLNTVNKLSTIANNLSNPSKVMSTIRSFNLPKGGEVKSDSPMATAKMADTNNDWRARLNILDTSFFDNAPILAPIKQTGGLIFPYTPTISIGSSAGYSDQAMTHSNYQFVYYQSSRVNEISVVGDFPVEDSDQAAYWLAVLHFLRSVTKMYTGNTGDSNPGNPPPILNFSAYGDFVFKNVPVVVTNFNIQLGKEVDYIAVNPLAKDSSTSGSGSSGADNLSKTANLLSTGLSAFGQTKAANLVKTGAALVGAVSALGGGAKGSAGTPGGPGESHVPTNSSITVNLRPVYSREKIRNFSLNTFIKGGYVGQGYL